MAIEPVPTYSEVSYTYKDKKGNLKHTFNPTWLKFFIDLGKQAIVGQVDLASQVQGVLPNGNGGLGVSVPVIPGAAVFVAAGGVGVTDTATFDGYTLQQVVAAIRQVGILA